jgi:hypothetical protein
VISVLGNNPVHVGYVLSSSSATSTFILCFSTLFSSQVKCFQSNAKNRRQLQKKERYKMACARYCAAPYFNLPSALNFSIFCFL